MRHDRRLTFFNAVYHHNAVAMHFLIGLLILVVLWRMLTGGGTAWQFVRFWLIAVTITVLAAFVFLSARQSALLR